MCLNWLRNAGDGAVNNKKDFIVSKQDAEEQYQKAKEFYKVIKNYLLAVP